ncbi:hypothetical protein B0H13DRAFT_1879841 [Mycena leptocephala]|nr:hypothetical protein B0H13DRAFT_1879841 [Mycena leptocephala]
MSNSLDMNTALWFPVWDMHVTVRLSANGMISHQLGVVPMLFAVGRLHPPRSRPTDPASIFYNDQRNFMQTSYIGSKLQHGLTISQKADIELVVVADGREAMGAAQKDDARMKTDFGILRVTPLRNQD